MRDGESFEDYAMRLYRNKGAYDLTYKEIGRILNGTAGNDWDESAYRKKYLPLIEGYEKGYSDGYEEGMQIDDKEKVKYIEELEEERRKLFKMKKRVQDQNRELRKGLTVEARSEHLQSIIKDVGREIAETKPLDLNFKPIPEGEKEAILQISDWHYGEEVNQFNNRYNTLICKERVEDLTHQVIQACIKEEIQTLKVLNLGDMISGNIRVSARVLNEEDVITQTIGVSELISEMISEFSKYFNVEFYSVLDNHSRVTANYSQHIEKESFARIINWYVKGRVEDNPRIKVFENRIGEIEDYDIGIVDIFDEKALFTHGHNDKLRTMIPDLSLMSGIKPICIFTGHLHRNIEEEEHEIDLIVNPSLIGSGVYAKQIRKSSRPRQKLSTFKKKSNGKVVRDQLYFIDVG